MLFDFLKKKRQEKADDQQHWRERWQSLVPEENRSVPVTVDGQTRIAYIQINQFVVMLQAGRGGRLSEAGQNGGRRSALPLEMAQADDELRPLDIG